MMILDRRGTALERVDRRTIAPRPQFGQVTTKTTLRQSLGVLGTFDPADIGFEMLRRMRRDPTLSLAGHAFAAPLETMEWWFEPSSSRDQDKEVALAMTKNLACIFPKLIRDMFQAVYFGYAPFEKMFMVDKLQIDTKGSTKTLRGHVLWRKMRPWRPEDAFPRVKDGTGEFAGLEISGTDRKISKEKSMVFSIDEEFDDKLGRTRLGRAYAAWWAWEVCMQLANRYFERRAIPQRVLYVPPEQREDPVTGNPVDMMVEMGGYLDSLRHGDTLTFPHEIDRLSKQQKFRVESIGDDGRGDLFVDFMHYLDALKLRAFGIPEKAIIQGMQHGSFAETSEMVDVGLAVLDATGMQKIERINVDMVPQMTVFNYGPNVIPPRLMHRKFNRQDANMFARIISDVMTADRTNESGTRYTLAGILDPVDVARRIGSRIEDPESIPEMTDDQVRDAVGAVADVAQNVGVRAA